ncbi:MAG: DinB family protein [Anaerolineales bacterium]|jgi:uncharacterized damage-inducible protein DinB
MMSSAMPLLAEIFEGWDGHQTSLVNAITPLTSAQLRWRPADDLQSVGELARHIAFGRIDWFERMGSPGSTELAAKIDTWEQDRDGNRYIVESAVPIADQAGELVHWLEITWQMIEQTLNTWDVSDLSVNYRHTWNGTVYSVSRQWTIWRILTHDVHHSAQISLMLGMQGIKAFELGDLFGHITLPPLADAA